MTSHVPPHPATLSAEEQFELTEDGLLSKPRLQNPNRTRYKDGSSIDWLREDAAERDRQYFLRAAHGVKGLLNPMLDGARMSFVVVATGLGIGIAGAWLDVLVKWLGDLREGRCAYGFWYNQVACCTGLTPGEICTEWKSWSEYLGVRYIFAQSLLQSLVYVSLAVAFATSAAFLVKTYAPYAFHTGIPEIKAILGGYVLDSFLSPWTLLIKSLTLALSVASGLSLGKEGPLVHVSCCMAYLISRLFKQFRQSEAQKRKVLAAAAAAGVSVAFGSPLGGVLFGLEELDTFASSTDVMWRAFVASSVAAVSLQWVNPFGTSKLVLFEVSRIESNQTWRAFELVPWVTLGIVGGILGSILVRLNIRIAMVRKSSALGDWPVLEVLVVSAITAAACYLVVFARVQSAELVANLFQECSESTLDYHGLCNPKAAWRNMYLLLLTAAVKLLLTAWTFGMMVPAGIFLPTIAIGACLGRAMGLFTQEIRRSFPGAYWFQSCPPDSAIHCVSPGFYAVIGASAMLGGVTRMTISIVVILFELTGALSHVLPIMISVMISKFVGDAFGKDGVYMAWIKFRGYPWIGLGEEFRDSGESEATVMRPLKDVKVIRDGIWSVGEVEELVDKWTEIHGFPVVGMTNTGWDGVVGFVTREEVKRVLHTIPAHQKTHLCVFSSSSSITADSDSDSLQRPTVDLSETVDRAPIQLRQTVPLELVVSMFQKMNLHHVIIANGTGKMVGFITKRDVVRLLKRGFDDSYGVRQQEEDGDEREGG
ncbi:Cl-channel protein [Flagelloscypha sp. PMI_526]|nr:Cl-channel protein [Flagelloscypha sp. PMI_526]